MADKAEDEDKYLGDYGSCNTCSAKDEDKTGREYVI